MDHWGSRPVSQASVVGSGQSKTLSKRWEALEPGHLTLSSCLYTHSHTYTHKHVHVHLHTHVYHSLIMCSCQRSCHLRCLKIQEGTHFTCKCEETYAHSQANCERSQDTASNTEGPLLSKSLFRGRKHGLEEKSNSMSVQTTHHDSRQRAMFI